ncbi:hypothetical protein Gotur_019717 [Gossypium turneri]
MLYSQYVWSSITVNRKLLEGSGFLAYGHYKPGTDTFHLSCGECTITLEDVQLQLRLPVDGSALTGSVQSTDWRAICYDLLGAISDNIYKGRIEMG